MNIKKKKCLVGCIKFNANDTLSVKHHTAAVGGAIQVSSGGWVYIKG